MLSIVLPFKYRLIVPAPIIFTHHLHSSRKQHRTFDLAVKVGANKTAAIFTNVVVVVIQLAFSLLSRCLHNFPCIVLDLDVEMILMNTSELCFVLDKQGVQQSVFSP